MASRSCCLYAFLLLLAFQSGSVKGNIAVTPPQCRPVLATDIQLIQFFLNLLYLDAELNLRASTGTGLDVIAPDLQIQGPLPIGVRRANLDSDARGVIEEFGLQSVGQIRAIIQTGLVPPIQRPLLNLNDAFNNLIRLALNVTSLSPPFDPYASTTNFLLAIASISSVSQQYSVSIGPRIAILELRRLVDGLSSILAAKSGALRALLNVRANVTVSPYRVTVANLTARIAQAVNQLGGCGMKDEGLIVSVQLGAENRTTSNVIPADPNSLAFSRTSREVLRILYGTGNATRPGGFLPAGANGLLVRLILALRLA